MCKACKSECPLGVDMATLKAETLAHRHDTHGVPLRSRVFGGIRTLNRLGSATAPLSNLPNGPRPAATAAGPLARHHRDTGRCRVPAREPRAAGSAAARAPDGAPAGEVTLPGRLVHHLHRAADRPGRRSNCWSSPAGRVRLESGGCCGRASFSKGLLDDARRKARRAGREAGVVPAPARRSSGCEPSCLLTLRDETPSLLPDDPHVARRRRAGPAGRGAARRGHRRGPACGWPTTSWPAGRRILYHGHCHQKAEVGTAATMALLRRIPGAEVVELDAGCCGMAGSFGFEAEHYDLSMTVGEDRLFPAVQAERRTPSSPRPGCRAGSRSATAPSGRPGIRSNWSGQPSLRSRWSTRPQARCSALVVGVPASVSYAGGAGCSQRTMSGLIMKAKQWLPAGV